MCPSPTTLAAIRRASSFVSSWQLIFADAKVNKELDIDT
jgi:hypothetical protein